MNQVFQSIRENFPMVNLVVSEKYEDNTKTKENYNPLTDLGPLTFVGDISITVLVCTILALLIWFHVDFKNPSEELWKKMLKGILALFLHIFYVIFELLTNGQKVIESLPTIPFLS